MQNKEKNTLPDRRPAGPTDFLANERTFLAWVRTGIAVMAFGFVVVKFNLFLQQAAILIGNDTLSLHSPYSKSVGIILTALGTIITLLAFFHYRKTDRQLRNGQYVSSFKLSLTLTFLIMISGGLLVFYLII